MKRMIASAVLGLAFTASSFAVDAKGYLALKPTKLEELVVGLGDAGFGVSTKMHHMETGRAYKLEIKSTGTQECAFVAPEFFNFIWLRKVEAGGMEIKATALYELEFEDEGEAEIYFVPIRPGSYDWKCEGLAHKGMTGTFEVK